MTHVHIKVVLSCTKIIDNVHPSSVVASLTSKNVNYKYFKVKSNANITSVKNKITMQF